MQASRKEFDFMGVCLFNLKNDEILAVFIDDKIPCCFRSTIFNIFCIWLFINDPLHNKRQSFTPQKSSFFRSELSKNTEALTDFLLYKFSRPLLMRIPLAILRK